MRVALCLGGGEVRVVRSFLGVRGEFFGATGKKDGGVDDQPCGSINDCTSSSLLSDLVGEGAHGIVMIGGCADELGAAASRIGGGGAGNVSNPVFKFGKLLLSKVTSLDNL